MSDYAIPWTAAHQAPLSMGFFPAGILEWIAVSFSRGSFWPRDWIHVPYISCIVGRFFTAEPPGKPLDTLEHVHYIVATGKHLKLPEKLKYSPIHGVCVCVCVWERERERERHPGAEPVLVLAKEYGEIAAMPFLGLSLKKVCHLLFYTLRSLGFHERSLTIVWKTLICVYTSYWEASWREKKLFQNPGWVQPPVTRPAEFSHTTDRWED